VVLGALAWGGAAWLLRFIPRRVPPQTVSTD